MGVRFRDLSPAQREALCNGCGPKFGGKVIPDWVFTASCDHHDFNYWLGFTAKDRKRADKQWYEAMKKDAAKQPWYARWWYYSMAWRYYIAVRAAGGAFFNDIEDRRDWTSGQVDDWIESHTP